MGPIKIDQYARFICIFSLIILSCSSEKKMKEETTTPEPAEPTEIQLLETGINKLKNWAEFWESKGADLNVKNFHPKQEHEYEVIEWPEENVLSEENPLKTYQIPNPGSKGILDIYSYKLVVDDKNQVDFNPDSEVVYYKNNGMRERLLFIGPSGIFEDAVWISDEQLMVSGHLQKEDGYVPIVWLVYPHLHQYTIFESIFSTKDYSPDEYLREKLENLNF